MSLASGFDSEVRSFEVTRSSFAASIASTVFIIGDDVSLRDTLGSLIRDFGWRAETFASAEQFLSGSPVGGPSCLVLDVTTPGLNGLDLQRRVAAHRSSMPIVLVTGSGDVLMTVHASNGGFAKSITTPLIDDGLLSTIERCIEWSEMALRHEAEFRALRDRHASLSCREREVMALVVAGLLNKQVACELGLSEITVKAHRGRVMRKMEANSLADLVRKAACLRLPQHEGNLLLAERGLPHGRSPAGPGRLN
jgi:FixJ family two-component response regulator